MTLSSRLLLAQGAALGLLTAAAVATTTTADFEGGAAGNVGGWTYGLGPTYPTDNGISGQYMLTSNLDTFAPMLRTTGGSAFTGDYRAAGVTTVSLDLATFDVDFSAGGRPLTIMLINTHGTQTSLDDTVAYFMGPNIPVPGEGWKSYTFDIPSSSETLPDGWLMLDSNGDGTPDGDWNDAITNVTKLQFFYGDPTFFFIFQQWDLGVDNISITVADDPGIPGDLDGNGIVDGADLGLLLAAWGGDGPADLDGNGVVDGADLGVLLGNWS
ncbi:MAG: hypothetical protein KDA22_02235 [Phycisphaerales bacterium]|nr:hypothetical protein [Phycisphaerales bacterium]